MNTKIHNDFCILILTHKRANNVITYKTLMGAKCTYPIFFVLDNEDTQIQDYCSNFGKDRVVVFDKKLFADKTDEGDNFNNRATITHARNACFDIAKKMGYKYFVQLDDDYTDFRFRFNSKTEYIEKETKIKNIDNVFSAFLTFYKNTPFTTIAFAQGGDFIGGSKGTMGKKVYIKRKAMNSFFCCTDRPFKFVGRLNEDVNTYVSLGAVGKLFGTINFVCLQQKQTQSQKGGISETYLNASAHFKPFYTVMYAPSCVKITLMGNTKETSRLHHKINWENAVPKIISEEYRKL